MSDPAIDPEDARVLFEYPMTGDARDVAVLCAGDARRLGDAVFLNDNIIDFRIKFHLLETFAPAEHIHAFSCQFYTRLCNATDSGEAYRLVQSWTKSFRLLHKELVFIPINMHHHWSLVVVVRPYLAIQVC